MTTLTSPATPQPVATGPRAGVGVAPRVRFDRLVLIELRKLVDTRAALGLIIGTFLLSVVIMGSLLFFMASPEGSALGGLSARALIEAGTSSLHLLLPVMAILLATTEWSQRGALGTFTVEPRRLRVVAAKVLAVALACVALFVVVAALSAAAAAGFAAATGATLDWHVEPAHLGWMLVTAVLSGLMGVALGMLLMNTPAAIVAYFVIPIVLQTVSVFSARIAEFVSWIDTAAAFAPLTGGAGPVDWAKVVVSASFWVLLPLVAGGARLVRREIS